MSRLSFIDIDNPGIMSKVLLFLWADEDGKLGLDLSPAASSFPRDSGVPTPGFKILLEGEPG